jgi:hypothetical protein
LKQEQEEIAIAMQWRGEHVSAAMNQHASTEICLKRFFLYCPRQGYRARMKGKS